MARNPRSRKPNAPKGAKSPRSARSTKSSRTGGRRARSGTAPGGDLRERVIDAALALAAEQPWNEVTLQQIAARAEAPLAEMVEAFPTKLAIVQAFMRRTDRQVLAGVDPNLAAEPPRERLFDVLMSRFEALNPHKAAVRSLWRSLSREPDVLMVLNRSAIRSQIAMLAAAGIDAEGLAGIARAQGLAVIFARTLLVWLADDDPGMARTMAALDRRLRDGEKLMRPLESVCTAARITGTFCSALFGRRGDRGSRGGERDGGAGGEAN